MILFQVTIKGYKWWIAAEDESDVFTYLRDDLYCKELSDEEIDEALEDPDVRKLTKRQAMSIDIVDEFGDKLYSVWNLFEGFGGVGVMESDFNNKPKEDEDLDDFVW